MISRRRSWIRYWTLGYRSIVLCVLLSLSVPATADDQDSIDYRQHVMKTIDEQVNILGMIAHAKAPASSAMAQAKVLALAATTAKAAFETKVQGGDSKPEVWSQWVDFAKRLDSLVAATDELAKNIRPGDPADLAKRLNSLPCQDCHDHYLVKR